MNQIETLLNQAWANSFQTGPNSIMSALQKTDGSPLTDVPYKSKSIDICSSHSADPHGQGPSPDGDADVNLTGMTVSGLENASNGGDPVYNSDDSGVAFTLNISSFKVTGTCAVRQRCCTSWLIAWCTHHFHNNDSEAFTATFSNSTITMNCSITQEPSVIVESVSVTLGGTSVHVNDGAPSWLKWLDKIIDNSGVKGSLKANAESMLGSPPLMSQMQTAINSQLNASSSPVSAITPSMLSKVLHQQGLPPNAYPTGFISARKQPDGSYIFKQPWRTSNRNATVSYTTSVKLSPPATAGEAPGLEARVETVGSTGA